MSLYLNQISKDIYLNRNFVFLWLVLVALNVWFFGDPISLANWDYARVSEITTIAIIAKILEVFLIALLVPKLVQDDCLVSMNAGWRTRPIEGSTLAWAKLTTILGLFIVYPIFCDSLSAIVHGEARSLFYVALETLSVDGLIVIFVMAVAATVKDLLRVWFTIGVGWLLLVLVSSMGRLLGGTGLLDRGGLLPASDIVHLWAERSMLLAAGMVAIPLLVGSLVISYTRNRIVVSKVIIILAVIGCAWVLDSWRAPIVGISGDVIYHQTPQKLIIEGNAALEKEMIIETPSSKRSEKRVVLYGYLEASGSRSGDSVESILLRGSAEMGQQVFRPSYGRRIYTNSSGRDWSESAIEFALGSDSADRGIEKGRRVSVPIVDLSYEEYENLVTSENGRFYGSAGIVYASLERFLDMPLLEGAEGNRYGFRSRIHRKIVAEGQLTITFHESEVRRNLDPSNVNNRSGKYRGEGSPDQNNIGLFFPDSGRFALPEEKTVLMGKNLVSGSVASLQYSWDLERIAEYGNLDEARLTVVEYRLRKIEQVEYFFDWNERNPLTLSKLDISR